MKYAFMSFSCPEYTFQEMAVLAVRFGYDGVEPRIDSGHNHGVERDASAAARRQVRATAAEHGIEICCVATSCRFSDPGTVAENVRQAREAIALAADLGSPCIRVFGGALPEDVSRDEAIEQVAAALGELAPAAAKAGVTVALETHDDWCHPTHVAAVMEKVADPAVAVNWDVMHPVRRGGATVEFAHRSLAPWIRHLHVHDGREKDGKVQFCEMGKGIVDHRTAIRCMVEDGYEGYVSGEWIHWAEPVDIYLPRERAMLREYEREARSHDGSAANRPRKNIP